MFGDLHVLKGQEAVGVLNASMAMCVFYARSSMCGNGTNKSRNASSCFPAHAMSEMAYSTLAGS